MDAGARSCSVCSWLLVRDSVIDNMVLNRYAFRAPWNVAAQSRQYDNVALRSPNGSIGHRMDVRLVGDLGVGNKQL